MVSLEELAIMRAPAFDEPGVVEASGRTRRPQLRQSIPI